MELFIALAGLGLGYALGSFKREVSDVETFDEGSPIAEDGEESTTEFQEEK